MLSFIFATLREAKPFIEKLGIKVKEKIKPPIFFEFNSNSNTLLICICGIGIELAKKSMEECTNRYSLSRAINIGICGTVNDELKINSLYSVSETIYWPNVDRRMFTSNLDVFKDIRSVKLATCKEPIFDSDLRKKINAHADIVDMEGAAIAEICNFHNIEYCFLKGVSDMADKGHKEILFENIDKLAVKMADKTLEIFNF